MGGSSLSKPVVEPPLAAANPPVLRGSAHGFQKKTYARKKREIRDLQKKLEEKTELLKRDIEAMNVRRGWEESEPEGGVKVERK